MTSLDRLFSCFELQWKNRFSHFVCDVCFSLHACARSKKVCCSSWLCISVLVFPRWFFCAQFRPRWLAPSFLGSGWWAAPWISSPTVTFLLVRASDLVSCSCVLLAQGFVRWLLPLLAALPCSVCARLVCARGLWFTRRPASVASHVLVFSASSGWLCSMQNFAPVFILWQFLFCSILSSRHDCAWIVAGWEPVVFLSYRIKDLSFSSVHCSLVVGSRSYTPDVWRNVRKGLSWLWFIFGCHNLTRDFACITYHLPLYFQVA
jgi:hypothetical protein